MQRMMTILAVFSAAAISLFCAALVCVLTFEVFLRQPTANAFIWWSLTTYAGLFAVFGSLFLLTFGLLMGFFLRALKGKR